MKSAALVTIVLSLLINSAFAAEAEAGAASAAKAEPGTETTGTSEAEVDITGTTDSTTADFCFFSGTPPSDLKYTVIRNLKVGKGTYGSVTEILPNLATHAKKIGADAIMGYTGSQRFGFFPWRMVRPVVRGVAIKWSEPQSRDCAALGGTTLKTILASNKPPAQ